MAHITTTTSKPNYSDKTNIQLQEDIKFMIDDQDEDLEQLSQSVSTVKKMAQQMNQTTHEQKLLIDNIDASVTRQTWKTKDSTKKIINLMKKMKSNSMAWFTAGVLIVLTIVLVIVVVV